MKWGTESMTLELFSGNPYASYFLRFLLMNLKSCQFDNSRTISGNHCKVFWYIVYSLSLFSSLPYSSLLQHLEFLFILIIFHKYRLCNVTYIEFWTICDPWGIFFYLLSFPSSLDDPAHPGLTAISFPEVALPLVSVASGEWSRINGIKWKQLEVQVKR